MPRHAEHPGSSYTIAVVVKLNPEAIAILDKLRGKTPRSTYLRELLKADAKEKLAPRVTVTTAAERAKQMKLKVL